MSEEGWREFLAAEGVDDWVVLHGGATAVFRVPLLGEAAQLAGAVAQVRGLAIAAKPDVGDLPFWRAVIGYAQLDDHNAIDPLGHGSTVWMQELDPAKPLRHAMHVDVSVAREHVETRLASALAAGGRIVDAADAPVGWILADRAGNRVCITAWPDGPIPPSWSTSQSAP
jgi:4a-hydroxytetrahydrobiopterin dehydratase